MSGVYQRTTFSAVDAATFCFPCMLQVGIDIPSQQMMTVKIMSKGVKQDEFIGVVVVPVSRLMSGKYHLSGLKFMWHALRPYNRRLNFCSRPYLIHGCSVLSCELIILSFFVPSFPRSCVWSPHVHIRASLVGISLVT